MPENDQAKQRKIELQGQLGGQLGWQNLQKNGGF